MNFIQTKDIEPEDRHEGRTGQNPENSLSGFSYRLDCLCDGEETAGDCADDVQLIQALLREQWSDVHGEHARAWPHPWEKLDTKQLRQLAKVFADKALDQLKFDFVCAKFTGCSDMVVSCNGFGRAFTQYGIMLAFCLVPQTFQELDQRISPTSGIS